MWVVMVLVQTAGLTQKASGGLLHNMVTRFMGLIVIAMVCRSR
jgi:hypothetical protein